MNKKLDTILYDSLKPENEPEPELNRHILEWRMRKDMRRFNVRKTAVAAAIGCLVVTGGVSAYAATQHISLLSVFSGESKEVKENAAKLLDTNVEQKQGKNIKQSQLVDFEIQEAICDKNQVMVQIAAKAMEPDKYLLVQDECDLEKDSVGLLNMDGLKGKQKIADYAKSIGKKCLRVGVAISCDAPSQSMSSQMESDGTIIYTVRFSNEEKNTKLKYVCDTFVLPADSTTDSDIRKGKIEFVLSDKSEGETIKYLPISKEKVAGTDLVIDEVIIEKSDLEMVCDVKYHYVGKAENWKETKDYDIGFFMLDSDGNIIESKGGGSTSPDDTKEATDRTQYSLRELPDTITFQAKDVMEKKLYGKVDLKLVK